MNSKLICVKWTLLCVACMVVMLVFATHKTVVIADVSPDGTTLNNETELSGARQRDLQISKTYGVQRCFYVHLPKEVRAENIVMENRYQDKKLFLHIETAVEAFFDNYNVDGDISSIISGRCEEQQNGILLELQMNHIYEYRSTMEGNQLTIFWYEPKELYEYIAVVDPIAVMGISNQEEYSDDIALQIARCVQKSTDIPQLKIYLTRSDKVEQTDDDKLDFVEELQSDFYLGITMSEADDEKVYGISGIYNHEFYFPDFGNQNFADFMIRQVTISSGNKAVGLVRAEEKSFLKELHIPATILTVGYLSNEQENYLLHQDFYQNKIAEGIMTAFSEVVQEIKQLEEME